jgi:hypothetical protein
MVYRFMRANRDRHAVREMAELFGVAAARSTDGHGTACPNGGVGPMPD